MNIANCLYFSCNVSFILYDFYEWFIKPDALLAQHHQNLNVTCYILLLHVIVGSVITHEIIVKALVLV